MKAPNLGLYTLNHLGQPVPEPDVMKWAFWFEDFSRRIVRETLLGDARVSTVFLGVDHNITGHGPPLLWETMLFSKQTPFKETCWRCTGNREQAEAQHERIVREVQTDLIQNEKRPQD